MTTRIAVPLNAPARAALLAALAALVMLVAPALARADSWAPAGGLLGPHGYGKSIVLPSGSVWLAGGVSTDGTERYDPATGVWSSTSPLPSKGPASLALLGDGTVFVASYTPQIYNPVTNTFAPTAGFAYKLPDMPVISLADGSVLAAGGGRPGEPAFGSTIRYTAGAASPWGFAALVEARRSHTLTRLADGRVLAAGGEGAGGGRLDSTEVYDPAAAKWTASGRMIAARADHIATPLADGRVLVAGGRGAQGLLTSAEIYNPATGAWSPAGALGAPRRAHAATLLPSGKVLVTGGRNANDGSLSSTELYDPATNSWSPGPAMTAARGDHTAQLLPSGKVLVAGGYYDTGERTAELYTPDGPSPGGPGAPGAPGGPGAPPPGTPPGGPSPLTGAGNTLAGAAPVITAARLSATRFRAAGRGAMLARTPTGTTLT